LRLLVFIHRFCQLAPKQFLKLFGQFSRHTNAPIAQDLQSILKKFEGPMGRFIENQGSFFSGDFGQAPSTAT
tara:strand:+ start:515 stop:730 length:216 start_codon:yes stop_codon:yes gene_type:complete